MQTNFDLHICGVSPDSRRGLKLVAIVLQEDDKLITEIKYGHLVYDWEQVENIVNGLRQAATEAFGPHPLRDK